MRRLQQGFTLLEVLLVLTVSAAILTVGVRMYRQFQQHVQLMQIQSDVAEIQAALRQYYFSATCDPTFASSLTPNVSGLPEQTVGVALPLQRLPIVENYSVAIEDTGKRVGQKPVYWLKVSAEIDSSAPLSAAVYKTLLQAGAISGNTISWKMLPSNNITRQDGPLWLLDARRQGFKILVSQGSDDRCIG